MLDHNEPGRDARSRAVEQRVALELMMTPWVWAMAPAWAWWHNPPPVRDHRPLTAPAEARQ